MPQYKVYNPKTRKFSQVKQTIKFLSFCRDPLVQKGIISKASPNILKAICNAAYNAQSGEVNLTNDQKRILKKHRGLVHKLVDRKLSIDRKRRVLTQSGGSIIAAVLPIILSTVLSSLGSVLFKRK